MELPWRNVFFPYTLCTESHYNNDLLSASEHICYHWDMHILKMHSSTPGSEEEASWWIVTSGWVLKIISTLAGPSSKNHHSDTQELEFSLTLHAWFFFSLKEMLCMAFRLIWKELEDANELSNHDNKERKKTKQLCLCKFLPEPARWEGAWLSAIIPSGQWQMQNKLRPMQSFGVAMMGGSI